MFAAHEGQWQQLLAASRPPSLGGASIALPNTGFAAAASQPGGVPQPPQPPSGFGAAQFAQPAPAGTGFAPVPGSFSGVGTQGSAFGGSGFGSGGAVAGGGFGGGVFGLGPPKRAIAFGGGGAATPIQQFGGPQQQLGPFGSAFGGGFGSRPVFGSQQPENKASAASPGPFQAQAVSSADHRDAATGPANGDGTPTCEASCNA